MQPLMAINDVALNAAQITSWPRKKAKVNSYLRQKDARNSE